MRSYVLYMYILRCPSQRLQNCNALNMIAPIIFIFVKWDCIKWKWKYKNAIILHSENYYVYVKFISISIYDIICNIIKYAGLIASTNHVSLKPKHKHTKKKKKNIVKTIVTTRGPRIIWFFFKLSVMQKSEGPNWNIFMHVSSILYCSYRVAVHSNSNQNMWTNIEVKICLR